MLLRSAASYFGTADWAHLRGLLEIAVVWIVAAGCALALAIGLGAKLWWPHSEITPILFIALPLLVLLPLTDSSAAALRGLHRMALGQTPEFTRGLFYMIALALTVFVAGVHLDAKSAMWLRVAAETAALVAGVGLLLNAVPRPVFGVKPSYQLRSWRTGLASFAAADATQLLLQQIDIVMLGIFRPMHDVGTYRMATNFAMVVFFASIIAGVMMNPVIATSWAQGEKHKLQDVSVRLSRIGFGLTLVVFLGMLAFSPLFTLILGHDFKDLPIPLAILGAGYVFRAGVSSAPSILLMTGGERDVALGTGIAAIANTALNFVLIPVWGMGGSAFATALCMSLLGVYFAVRAHQRTGIDGTIFGRWGSRHALPPA